MRNVSDRVVETIKTYIVGPIMSPHEYPEVYEVMWKNTVQANKPQMAIKHGARARALRAGKLRLQTQLTTFNTVCLSTVIMITRRPLNVTLYAH
jgi:hypothetical protein